MLKIEVTNEQTNVPLDEQRLEDAVRMILQDGSVANARISVAVVDDPAICKLHRRYLEKDGPTDVLSFVYQRSGEFLEGEVIVSAETADATAPRFDWPAQDELLLYVIHGTLHLVGYDDTTVEAEAEMRQREQAYLARFGLQGRY